MMGRVDLRGVSIEKDVEITSCSFIEKPNLKNLKKSENTNVSESGNAIMTQPISIAQ